jgi:hypothetical protein
LQRRLRASSRPETADRIIETRRRCGRGGRERDLVSDRVKAEFELKQIQITKTSRKRARSAPDLRAPSGGQLPY